MYLLTLYEPWSWAITEPAEEEAKRVENRRWPPPPWIRRRWIALHSGLHYEQESQLAIGHRLGTMPPGRLDPIWRARHGHVTAMVRIDGYRKPHDEIGLTPADARWWFRAQFGWTVGAMHKLATPVKVRGGQKLRRVAIPAALAIADQVPPEIIAGLAVPV